jgi:hypothetical protein
LGPAGIQNCSNDGEQPYQGEIKAKSKDTLIFFNLLKRTSKPISMKLDTNHPWVKEILICPNEGPSPLQREDNHKNVVGHLKIFSRTTEPGELIFT